MAEWKIRYERYTAERPHYTVFHNQGSCADLDRIIAHLRFRSILLMCFHLFPLRRVSVALKKGFFFQKKKSTTLDTQVKNTLDISPWTSCAPRVCVNCLELLIGMCPQRLTLWPQVASRMLLSGQAVKVLNDSRDCFSSTTVNALLLCPWSIFESRFFL